MSKLKQVGIFDKFFIMVFKKIYKLKGLKRINNLQTGFLLYDGRLILK
jgi:hypothetical protein